jgi:enoyl-CoA hydratase/carnithine racemase
VAKALELIWTGRWVDAQEMLQIGYVSKVVPFDELAAATGQFAKELAKVINWITEDSMEGPRAYAERREPIFKGR